MNRRHNDDYWQAVQDEFRAMPVLTRFWGLNRATAGVANWGMLKAMHNRQCEILENADHVKLRGIPVPAAVVGFLAFLIPSWYTTRDLGEGWLAWFYVLFIPVIAGLFASVAGLAIMALKRYNSVYGFTLILGHEQSDPASTYIPHAAITSMPRLGFCAEPGYYFGSTREAGISQGRILLQTRGDENMLNMAVRDLYNLHPGAGDWTGTAAKSGGAIVEDTCNLADADREIAGRKASPITLKNGILLLFIILAAVGMVNIMSGGTVVDPSHINPDAIQGFIEGG